MQTTHKKVRQEMLANNNQTTCLIANNVQTICKRVRQEMLANNVQTTCKKVWQAMFATIVICVNVNCLLVFRPFGEKTKKQMHKC